MVLIYNCGREDKEKIEKVNWKALIFHRKKKVLVFPFDLSRTITRSMVLSSVEVMAAMHQAVFSLSQPLAM